MDWLFGGTKETIKWLKIVLTIFHLMNLIFIFTMDITFRHHFIILEVLLTLLTCLIIYIVPRDTKIKTT